MKIEHSNNDLARTINFQKVKMELALASEIPVVARAKAFVDRAVFEKKHVIITIANHFEPGWSENGILDHKTQIARLKAYRNLARDTAESVFDADGTAFRHTNFYPAEQYHPEILDFMADMQAEGLGEVEVHLHHEGAAADTSDNVRRTLLHFRDTLAEKHRCLSQMDGTGDPMFAFIHGNLALANSSGGRFCGVDNEMEILRDTGCYVDMTLPSAPDQSQVPVINQIYECGLPMHKAAPHRRGNRVEANGKPASLPLIFTGPLVFNWTRRIGGFPVPRIDDGALAANQPVNIARFNRWRSANVTVAGKPDWVFVKLYCHGFFGFDQQACIGEETKRFFNEVIEHSTKTGAFKVHFASAREAFNMVAAAIDGKLGEPGSYRDYRLRSIMAKGGLIKAFVLSSMPFDFLSDLFCFV